jgi:hypothetical protein
MLSILIPDPLDGGLTTVTPVLDAVLSNILTEPAVPKLRTGCNPDAYLRNVSPTTVLETRHQPT